MVKVVQRHVHRDRVDEECARLGIVYKKWQPLNPKQKSHPSVRDIEDSTVIPDEQEVPYVREINISETILMPTLITYVCTTRSCW